MMRITQVKLKRLQRGGKRDRLFMTKAKKNLFYTMCRYIRWTMARLDGSYETIMMGLKTDLAKHP